MRSQFILFVALLALASCANDMPVEKSPKHVPELEEREVNEFVMHTEMAHKKYAYQAKGAISFDLRLVFREKERLNATFTMLTDGSKGRIDRNDGISMVYDGMDSWIVSDSVVDSDMRFDIYTWSYFFGLPYKLSDDGTKYAAFDNDSLNGEQYNTQKLTFEAGTGDAPDDWYILYSDKETELLEVAAYIVTAGQSVEDAEEDPHAIKYEDYIDVDGIPIASNWSFWAWRTEAGLTEQLGYAELTNIEFQAPDSSLYMKP